MPLSTSLSVTWKRSSLRVLVRKESFKAFTPFWEQQLTELAARGDKKRARARLRGGAKLTTHHFSTFRTGMALGLGVPALAAGVYQSASSVSMRCLCRTSVDTCMRAALVGFQEETRAGIPGWDGLMFVYGIFFVPTFFSLLVGANLLVWARARINYVFIFGGCMRVCMGI